jgi:Ca-activated chloride channel family protein
MKRLIVFSLLVIFLAAGCAPAATPTQIAAATTSHQMAVPTSAPAVPPQRPAAPQPPAWAPTSLPWKNQPHPEYPDFAEGAPYAAPDGQPLVDTRRDHLSTFGLDVDTASYTQARQSITNGSLLPVDAIRVEEFVNFFKQDYPTPKGIAFGIYADGAPSPFGDENLDLLRFGIQGYREDEDTRKPRHLTFVIDASGSMGDAGKLDLVKQTLGVLLSRLGSRDEIAIVAYNTHAWRVLGATSVYYRSWIESLIDQLSPSNSTNLAEGLRLGYQLADQSFDRQAVNRVILCTDGVANTGETDASSILEMIHEYAGREITLTALGVGMGDYNDALLEQLADQGNGNYAYIDDLDEARRLFVDKLASTLDVIAMNAKVQVDFNPDVVASFRQMGYEDRAIADQNFRNDAVDAGEIGAGHSVTALYQVRLKPGTAGRIATVQLRWEDPQTHQVKEINGNFNTWDLAARFDDASPRFQLDVIAAYFAGLLRSSNWAWSAPWESLESYAWQVVRQLPEDRDVQELATLIGQAQNIGN